MKSRFLWPALLLCCLNGRCWGGAVFDGSQAFPEAVDALKSIATNASASESAILAMANGTLDRMPYEHFQVPVRSWRSWDIVKPNELPETPADIDRLLESARKRRSSSRADVPLPVRQAMDRASQMNQEGRMGFNALADHVMGFYRYWKGKMTLGVIKLNEDLSALATLIGDDLVYSTVVHEDTHAADHQDGKLDGHGTIAVEVSAFKTENMWLKVVDPYAERVCFLRAKLMNMMLRNPCRLFQQALNYLRHLADIQATNGDEQKLRELAVRRGYRDDTHERRGPLSS